MLFPFICFVRITPIDNTKITSVVTDRIKSIAHMKATDIDTTLNRNSSNQFDIDKASDPIKWLIEQGPRIVPTLCRSIHDQTATQFIIPPAQGFRRVFRSTLYDRYSSVIPNPEAKQWSDQLESEFIRKPYRLTIGDICFFILGRIVNRNFFPYHWVVMTGAYVGAPSLVPQLGANAISEWGAATPEKIRISLIQDVEQPDQQYRDVYGVACLKRYFPKTLDRVVPKRLSSRFLNYVDDEEEFGQDGNCLEKNLINAGEATQILDEISEIKSVQIDAACLKIVKMLSSISDPRQLFFCNKLLIACGTRLKPTPELAKLVNQYVKNSGPKVWPEVRDLALKLNAAVHWKGQPIMVNPIHQEKVHMCKSGLQYLTE